MIDNQFINASMDLEYFRTSRTGGRVGPVTFRTGRERVKKFISLATVAQKTLCYNYVN